MSARWFSPRTLGLLAALVIGVAGFVFVSRFGARSISAEASGTRDLVAAHSLVAATTFLLVHVIAGAFWIPVVWPMNFAAGALFDPWLAFPLVAVGSATGAVSGMLTARRLLRGRIERRFPDLVRRFDVAAERHGAAGVFAARLTPFLPFPVVNAAAGVSSVRLRTFAAATAVGVLPMAAIATLCGMGLSGSLGAASSPSFALSPAFGGLLAVVGCAPLAARIWIARRMRATPARGAST